MFSLFVKTLVGEIYQLDYDPRHGSQGIRDTLVRYDPSLAPGSLLFHSLDEEPLRFSSLTAERMIGVLVLPEREPLIRLERFEFGTCCETEALLSLITLIRLSSRQRITLYQDDQTKQFTLDYFLYATEVEEYDQGDGEMDRYYGRLWCKPQHDPVCWFDSVEEMMESSEHGLSSSELQDLSYQLHVMGKI